MNARDRYAWKQDQSLSAPRSYEALEDWLSEPLLVLFILLEPGIATFMLRYHSCSQQVGFQKHLVQHLPFASGWYCSGSLLAGIQRQRAKTWTQNRCRLRSHHSWWFLHPHLLFQLDSSKTWSFWIFMRCSSLDFHNLTTVSCRDRSQLPQSLGPLFYPWCCYKSRLS